MRPLLSNYLPVSEVRLMRKLSLAVMVVGILLAPNRGQSLLDRKRDPYPNELPMLKLYQKAKWKSIEFNVSTKEDVEKLLGKPVPIFREGIGWVAGYDDDPEWRSFVSYFDGGNGCEECRVGRVTEIRLAPKQRVSLSGIVFSQAFEKSGLVDVNGVEFNVYRDKFGLLYAIYKHDSQDGQVHTGDLNQVSYSASYLLKRDAVEKQPGVRKGE
jgi:hypothetical protein